jgi:hypothetical protein
VSTPRVYQNVCHRKRHGSFNQIHKDQIKRSKVFIREHQKALGGIAKPPWHSCIVEMRLPVKVLKAAASMDLVKLESNNKFNVRKLYQLVQNAVDSWNKSESFHPSPEALG